MTFKEAVSYKSKKGDTIIESNIEMIVIIVPSNHKDFIRYLDDHRARFDFNDDVAKKYSSDNDFIVIGLSNEITGYQIKYFS